MEISLKQLKAEIKSKFPEIYPKIKSVETIGEILDIFDAEIKSMEVKQK